MKGRKREGWRRSEMKMQNKEKEEERERGQKNEKKRVVPQRL